MASDTLAIVLTVLNSISFFCGIIMLYKLTCSKEGGVIGAAKAGRPGAKLVVRAVFCMTICELLQSFYAAIQYIPVARGQTPPWATVGPHGQPDASCVVLAVIGQIGGVGDFSWAMVLAWLLLMLLLGYPSSTLAKTSKFQAIVAWGITLTCTIVPLGASQFGYAARDGECWIRRGAYRIWCFYAVFLLAFACCLAVLVVVACRYKVFQKERMMVGRMTAFVLYFFAIWGVPCANRLLQFSGAEVPVWVFTVHQICAAIYGTGSYILWRSLAAPTPNMPKGGGARDGVKNGRGREKKNRAKTSEKEKKGKGKGQGHKQGKAAKQKGEGQGNDGWVCVNIPAASTTASSASSTGARPQGAGGVVGGGGGGVTGGGALTAVVGTLPNSGFSVQHTSFYSYEGIEEEEDDEDNDGDGDGNGDGQRRRGGESDEERNPLTGVSHPAHSPWTEGRLAGRRSVSQSRTTKGAPEAYSPDSRLKKFTVPFLLM